MASKTRSLNVVISGDAKGFSRALTTAGKQTGDLEKRAKGHAAGISKSMLGAAAGAASFGAAVGALKSSISTVESLAKGTAMLSRTTGMDNKTASEWVSIAKTRGVEAKQLNMGFVALARNMRAGAQGTKASVDAFKELGVSQAVLKRGDASEVLNRVSDAFAKMPDGANKAALAQKLFSRQAGTLLPLINHGSAALREQLGVVDKYGAALDKHGVKQALRAVKAQREMGLAWQGVQIMLAENVIPVLATGAEKLGKFVREMRSGTGAGGRFVDTLRDIRNAVAPVVKFFKDHPKLVATAAAGWAAYKVVSLAALTSIKVSNFRKAFGIGKGAAAAEGAIAGRTYATTFAASSATGVGAAAKGGRLRGAMMGAGKVLGAVAGVALVAELANQIRGGAGGLRGLIENIFPLSPHGSSGFKLHPVNPRPDVTGPDSAGLTTPGQGLGRLPNSGLSDRIPKAQARVRARAGSVGATAHVAARVAGARASSAPRVGTNAPGFSASGRRLSQAQIAKVWVQAGGDSSQADVMSAIAMGESGGNTAAHNTQGEDSRGLWQINVGPGANTDLARFNLFDPIQNAKAAQQVLARQGLGAWTVYSSGVYRQFLGGGAGATEGGRLGGFSRGTRSRPHIRQGTAGRGVGRLPGFMTAPVPGSAAALELTTSTAGLMLAEAPDNAARERALALERRGISERAKKIRAALARRGKRKITGATRVRLQDELAGLMGRASEIDASVNELHAGPAGGDGEDPNQPLIDAINAKAEQDAQLAAEQAQRDEEARRAEEAHTAALKDVSDQMKRANDIGSAVQSTSNYQLTKTLADLISGHIVGRGVVGRSFTPGVGVAHVY